MSRESCGWRCCSTTVMGNVCLESPSLLKTHGEGFPMFSGHSDLEFYLYHFAPYSSYFTSGCLHHHSSGSNKNAETQIHAHRYTHIHRYLELQTLTVTYTDTHTGINADTHTYSHSQIHTLTFTETHR